MYVLAQLDAQLLAAILVPVKASRKFHGEDEARYFISQMSADLKSIWSNAALLK